VSKKQEGLLYLRVLRDLCCCSWRFNVPNTTLRVWIIFMEGKKEKKEKKIVRSLWQCRVKVSPFLTCLSGAEIVSSGRMKSSCMLSGVNYKGKTT